MPRPGPSTARSILFSLLVFLLFFGTIEGVLRLVGVKRTTTRPRMVVRAIDTDIELPFMRTDPELFWAPKAGWSGSFMDEPVTINALGLRGPDLAPSTRARRVLCLGDSITFGYGIGDAESYPAALGRRLAGRGVEVVNGGVTGYTSDQVAILLRRIGPEVKPALVTVLVGWNDRTLRSATDRESHEKLRIANLADGLSERLFLYRALSNLYGRRATAAPDPPRDRPRVRPEEYRENLAAIAATTRALGARLVMVALPFRRRAGEALLPLDYARLARSTAAELGVPLLEVGPLGENATAPNDSLFIDSLHFSPAGAEVMAGELARGLEAAGLP